MCFFFFFKQKTAYEMRISDWSSDVCSSDLTKRTRYPPKKATTGTLDRLDKPRPPLYKARRSWAQVAQLVEHATENRSVGGSTPSLGTISPYPVVSDIERSRRTRSGAAPRRREQAAYPALLLPLQSVFPCILCTSSMRRSEEPTSDLQSLMHISY